MPTFALRSAAVALLLVCSAGSRAGAIENVGNFNATEVASIASVKDVGVLKSVTVEGKGSVNDVINLDEVQAYAVRRVKEYLPSLRFLNCGAPKANRDPASNQTPIDCSRSVEDELGIAFRVWTVGDKKYPIAFHLKVEVNRLQVGEDAPQLILGGEKLGYTKKNRLQGIVEEYVDEFLNHLGLQLALAKSGSGSN